MYEDDEDEGYTLAVDNDSHWYVIPVDKSDEWNDFVNLDPDDEESWDVPEWAEAIGGHPSLVTFTKYRIN